MARTDFRLERMSQSFFDDYPSHLFPELLQKQARPYACLCLTLEEGILACIPYRTSMHHANGYRFRDSERSRKHASGLDYSKVILFKDSHYLSDGEVAIVDRDEYAETRLNIDKIAKELKYYIDRYVVHHKGIKSLHRRQYERDYAFSTLPYFHDALGLAF